MIDYKVWLDKLDKKLAEPNSFTVYLEKAEKSTGVRRLHLALGFGGLWALYMILGHFAELICNIICFVHPAYQSMIAIETHRKDDDTKWLTYWVVFSSFSVAEFFSDFLLNWIPFYWLIKCLFLLWCSVPSSNSGSHLIYHKFLRPVFLKNYAAINETLDKAASGAAGLLMEASSKVVSSGKTD